MNGFRLWSAGRGLHRPWLLTCLSVVALSVLLGWLRVGASLNPDMRADDLLQTAGSLGAIAVSAMTAWLLVPEIPALEMTAARGLVAQRGLLVALCLLANMWVFLLPGGLGLQHLGLAAGLFGLACLTAGPAPGAVAAPHVGALLLALVPKLVPASWNPLTPAQRGQEFLAVALALAFLGCAVHTVSPARPRRR